MIKKFLYAIISVFLILSSSANASGWEGKVIGVKDGETIIVFDGKNPPVSVRLNDVAGMGGCADAKKFVYGMVFGRMVKVESERRGDDGGISAEVIMPDGKSLNKELLRQDFMRHADGEKRDAASVELSEAISPVQDEPRSVASEISSKEDPPSDARQHSEPPPAPSVRKWRDKYGNIHFSGTVGEKE